jgi:HlyD family secretion protein
MKTTLLRIGAFLLAIGLCALLFHSLTTQATALAPKISTAHNQPVALACPGRVEGKTESIEVGAAIDGVIKSIKVTEGQEVQKGDVLAELDCSDLEDSLRVSQAEAESAEKGRTRLMHGSRIEERQAAAHKTAAAQAVRDQLNAQLDRMTKLHEAAAVSNTAFEQARRDFQVAEADLSAAKRNEELINAGPLPEEVGRADADVRAADQRIQLAQDKLSKCVVRAPLNGTVLRVSLRAGESFALLSPRPLFTIADLTARRVRAEVDEHDIGTAKVGEKVIVSSDAYGNRHFPGTVVRVSSAMGRKTVRTGDPADKGDRDVLEVLAELDKSANALPLGLRVTVQFVR